MLFAVLHAMDGHGNRGFRRTVLVVNVIVATCLEWRNGLSSQYDMSQRGASFVHSEEPSYLRWHVYYLNVLSVNELRHRADVVFRLFGNYCKCCARRQRGEHVGYRSVEGEGVISPDYSALARLEIVAIPLAVCRHVAMTYPHGLRFARRARGIEQGEEVVRHDVNVREIPLRVAAYVEIVIVDGQNSAIELLGAMLEKARRNKNFCLRVEPLLV